MRLQLTLVLSICPALLAASAYAQTTEPGEGTVVAKTSVYADDDDTTISTTLVDGQVNLPAQARVGAHVLIDVISTASVDVVSSATPHFDEVRIESGGRLGILLAGKLDLSASFTHSIENDWQSFAGALVASLEFNQRNTRLSAGYGAVHNQVGRADDVNFRETMNINSVQLGGTQLLDRKTLIGLTYNFAFNDGWQSSPYRYVWSGSVSVLERHPSKRMRHAATLLALRYLGRDVALDTNYRFYADDWGVLSHTLTTALRWAFHENWSSRLRARVYYQSAASFWRETYVQFLQYMSSDRELSTFLSLAGGLKLGWSNDHWSVNLKADALWYRFFNFARLRGRVALVADLGVGLKW